MNKMHRLAKRSAALAVAAALLAAAAQWPAAAHTGGNVEMTCPYDGTKFTYYAQHSGTQFGRQLDLKPIGPIMSPWPIASCPTNGFVFLQEKYSDEELERLRPLIFSPEFQALKEETPYYRASWIMEHTGKSHADVSWMLLKATWEASENATERYKRYAGQLAKRLPEDIAAASGESKLTLQMLYAEMLRRLGQFDEAAEFLNKIEVPNDLQAKVGPLVAYQKELASRHDGAPHAMKEAFKEDDKEN